MYGYVACFYFVVFSLFSISSQAAINVAVASNFKISAMEIAEQFTEKYNIKVNISSASTGTLYQQILHGAPFDLFLSADQQHVQLLQEANKVGNNQSFVYAQGRLGFWMPSAESDPTIEDFMAYAGRLAIANPKFAPYGVAAQQALTSAGKWGKQQYIQGSNISQTYQFVESNNVAAGMVAFATLVQKNQQHYLLIPAKWHQPIIQAGIVLNTQQVEQANLFRDFLLSKPTQQLIHAQGYN
ncbi:molybdate ABC transporter substrate-binding protein [Psychromonas sp. 14N.309.X.WAT.B.A12]|uniref:molybdate ABC transporter substrate-binding protein n=1 Tax=Psychromonas sp. 14N.309.X.WAT.B.A12 TaxID=2998322 RepID=UPI0025AF1756|nr:molybdate ABC transporter substrate-binding protein [Psychromonas sp. 14N.309.X.WAT.B.A12]MDN2663202.1 molybdate ABC transporter substrate-binding protein [Psychromonas sp. 14N.309.X.WAT.B.A12]